MGAHKPKAKGRDKRKLEKRLHQRMEKKGGPELLAYRVVQAFELKPIPAPGESLEDTAIFSSSAREQLSAESQAEARVVADALQMLVDGKFDCAAEALKDIARSSPYSDWRLFVRGLIAFYKDDAESARANWQRLSPSRRPARIATTLLRAEVDMPLDGELLPPASNLVDTARELRTRPTMIAAAREIAAIDNKDSEIAFSGAQAQMLIRWRERFRRVDPDFVEVFSQACVVQTFDNEREHVFGTLAHSVTGPAHDPRWMLHLFSYIDQSHNDDDNYFQEIASVYLERVLPGLTCISQDLKNALQSVIHFKLAECELKRGFDFDRPFSFIFDLPDLDYAEAMLRIAIKAYPRNREAHEMLLYRFERERSCHETTAAQEKTIAKKVIAVQEEMVKAFPDDVPTLLELIDHYLREEELAKANKLIESLRDQRLDSPLARALPWKLKLREAMACTRRKATLADAAQALEAAESLWPAWLSKDWLPFLKRALELRRGSPEQFDQSNALARQSSAFGDAQWDLMTFAAVQQMGLPAAELKPFREAVERQVLNAGSLPLSEFCAIGSFFWDLARTGMEHKAYRLQAKKFGAPLCKRLKDGEQTDLNGSFFATASWTAMHGFFGATSAMQQAPYWVRESAERNPMVAAALLDWSCRSASRQWRIKEFAPLIEKLELAARSETDVFNSYRFAAILKTAKARMAESDSRGAYSSFL